MRLIITVLFLFLLSAIATTTSCFILLPTATRRIKRKPLSSLLLRETTTRQETLLETPRHIIDGVKCREIHIHIPAIDDTVKILEATAESQEDLVDMAVALEDETLEEQLLAAGDPYGAVLWPAAWAVANYVLSSSETEIKQLHLEEMTVLELGTGTGLVSISAALGGAKKVISTDYEPLALALTRYAAEQFHSISNMETQLLDMCDYEQALPPCDIVLAADIMYEPKTGVAMAHRAVEALKNNCRVIVGDSPGRPGRPAFLQALGDLGVVGAEFIDTVGQTCTGPRHDLICGKTSTSVSDKPKELMVAIMDLHPNMLVGS